MKLICFIMAFIIFFKAIKLKKSEKLKKKGIFYRPKKMLKLYDYIIADRGLCIKFKENTIPAYKNASLYGFIPKIDVRFTKDNIPICFHDKYTERLLGIPGSILNKTYENITRIKIKGSNVIVPSLEKYLKRIKKNEELVIELHGKVTFKNIKKLVNIIDKFCLPKDIYFFTSNILVYFFMKKKYKYVIIFKYNIFRENLKMLYQKNYKKIKLPNIYDIVFDIEQNESVTSIIHKLWKISNNYTSRISAEHWLFSMPLAHRAIYDSILPENSIESIEACVKNNVAIEIDITNYKGRLRCYHEDKICQKFGMVNSSADKIQLKDSVSLEQFIKIVDGKVPVIFDIKNMNIFSRKMEKSIMNLLKNYNGKYVIQSFNPMVLRWMYKNYPEIYRGQIGHSLNGLKKYIRNVLLTITNFVLFYFSKPDYILYDIDPKVRILTEFNNKVAGLPLILYAPKSYKELEPYLDVTDTFVIENISDLNAWNDYIKKRYKI